MDDHRISLSEVINVSRYDDPEWMNIHRELETYSTDKHVFKHTSGEVYRKGWEWTQCVYGLSKLGAIQPEARALGVGAGREPVIFWLSDRIRHVVATDLYGNETWSKSKDGSVGNEAPEDILHDATQYCPRPFNSSRVSFENADGTALQYEDNSFDFCWSLSSIEHFGGHDASRKAVQEMARVTRKGGTVAISTEYLLLDEPHPEYFTKQEIIDYLINATPSLRLVDEMSWELPPFEYLIDQISFSSEGVHRLRRHVVLNDGFNQWTSFMLFFRKQ